MMAEAKPTNEDVRTKGAPTDEAVPAGDAAEPDTADATDAAGDDVRDVTRAAAAEPDEDRSVAELAAALSEAERLRDEYLDHLQRARAEFDNFRKRNARERLEAMDRGAEQLVGQMLGAIDNLHYALEAAEESEDAQLAKGVRMVHSELLGVLHDAGLSEVPGEDSVFDPEVHEAVGHIDAAEELDEPIVAEVLRRGYRFKERLLRPASVTVKK